MITLGPAARNDGLAYVLIAKHATTQHKSPARNIGARAADILAQFEVVGGLDSAAADIRILGAA